jgi:hypothetical protein
MTTNIIYKKNYAKLCNQACISGTNLSFDLWITMANSLLKVALQRSTGGSSLLNIQEFCSFHIHQHRITIISIAKGTPSNLLRCRVAHSGFNHVGTITPIWFQQFLAKAHLRNRCLRLSSLCSKHNSEVYESNCIFLLLSIPLVFNLFCSSNQ